MPTLKNNPTLKNFQQYVSELETERGFASQTVIDKCLLLGEEVGELFKAVRKTEGLLIDSNSSFSEIGDELTDIFIYLCAIANRKGIDLEEAFRSKEEKNKQRTWKSI
ncbi:MazG nucleotide pyrophosphohydrolase domain-containing protein [uncultured Draconibacterium sp.]|uniref:MazG nucleotide pyrophosphohydrolase domain-containing protein n=1 Tax=uncultured Draconibacterium sp. TaxID=1573823 RepID=UPI0029C775F1|nr:MazG nucleotide pyrophosphohydrolase domain-containing protein [uncultured Draconibacterium sp.]